MEIYTLEEALNIMATRADNGEPIPFSIQFVTCSVKRNTAGERIKIKRAGMFTSAEFRDYKAVQASAKAAGEPGRSKNWGKAIRNIQCLDTMATNKVHIILIERINGVQVTL